MQIFATSVKKKSNPGKSFWKCSNILTKITFNLGWLKERSCHKITFCPNSPQDLLIKQTVFISPRPLLNKISYLYFEIEYTCQACDSSQLVLKWRDIEKHYALNTNTTKKVQSKMGILYRWSQPQSKFFLPSSISYPKLDFCFMLFISCMGEESGQGVSLFLLLSFILVLLFSLQTLCIVRANKVGGKQCNFLVYFLLGLRGWGQPVQCAWIGIVRVGRVRQTL